MFAFFIFLSIVSVSFVNGNANYTAVERKALDEFRNKVGDVINLEYMKMDSYLIRWLRARNFDVNAANDIIRSSLSWRKENKIDSILNRTIFEFNPPVYSIGFFDKKGQPVITFSPTHVDLRAYIVNGHSENLIRYWDQILEEAEWLLSTVSKKSDGRIFQGIAILDIHSFNLRQHSCLACIRVILNWVYTYEKNHPDMAEHLVFINAPRVFSPVLEILKPALAPATRKALKVFTSDKKVWSAFLLNIIPADQLSFQFGGTRKS